MSTLNLSNVETVATNYSIISLQEDNTGFKSSIKKDLTINGFIYKPTNYDGVESVWQEITEITEYFKNEQDIEFILNGKNFGTGKITSLNFEESVDVRLKKYNISVTIYQAVSDKDYTNSYLHGITLSPDELRKISNLSEEINYTKSTSGISKNSYEYSLSLNVILEDNPYSFAKNILNKFFDNFISLLGGFILGSSSGEYENLDILGTTLVENIDLINNNFSFTKKIELNENNSDTYTTYYTNNLTIGENGIISASESGEIKSLKNPYNINDLLSIINTVKSNAYNRCQNLLSNFFPLEDALKNFELNKSININEENGTVSYTFDYTNDPRIEQDYSWEYTLSTKKNNGIITITEQGNVVGKNHNDSKQRLVKAKTAYINIIKPGIQGRCAALYNGVRLSDFQLFSKTEGFSELNGSVDYFYEFSDDPSHISDIIKKQSIIINDTLPLPQYERMVIINNNREILHDLHNRNLGIRDVTINILAHRSASFSFLRNYCDGIKNTYEPATNDKQIDDETDTYEPQKFTFTKSITWWFLD